MAYDVPVQFVGIVAATASTLSFAPQAWKIIQSRDVTGLSAPMYLLTVSAFGLWLIYGWLKSDWALMIPNALCCLLSGFILAMIMMPPRIRNEVADAIESPKNPERN